MQNTNFQILPTKTPPGNSFRYLQTLLITGGGGLVSKFIWDIVVLQQGYPQGLTLGSLVILLCIHHVSDDLIANVKLFADDISVLFIRPYFDYGDVIYEQPFK